MKKARKKQHIRYKYLCGTGKSLSIWGLPTFLQHVYSCPICSKHIKK